MVVSRRTLEIAAAATLGLFGAAVVASSLQLNTGWGATGPQSGYVPLRLGVLLVIVSLLLLLQAARGSGDESFASGEQLRRSLSLFLPTVVMAVAMAFLGIYLTGAVYLGYMARRHGGLSWLRAVAFGVVSTMLFFAVFEIWFGVPLAKGPIETWLGF